MAFDLGSATAVEPKVVEEPTAPNKGGFDLGSASTEEETPNAALIRQVSKNQGQQASEHTDIPEQSQLGFVDQIFMAGSDNLDEQELYLKKKYPKAKLERETDEDGKVRLAVTKPGEGKVYTSEGFLPSLAADSPELIGSLLGAASGGAEGAALGPGGAIGGAIIGAGLGAGAGKAAKEGAKAAAGLEAKTPGGVVKSVGDAVTMGAAGEGFGRLAVKGIGMLRRPLPGVVTGATDETRRLTESTLARGARPPVRSYAPNAKSLQRKEILANLLVGPSAEQKAANVGAINSHVSEILESAGVPKDKIPSLISSLDGPQSTSSTKVMGEEIKSAAQAKVAAVQESVDKLAKEADTVLNARLDKLNAKSARYEPAALSQDAGKQIEAAHTDFQASAAKIYGKIDELAGGKPIVPTQGLKRELVGFLKRFPEIDVRLKGVLENKVASYGENITFQQAQDLRTYLRGMAQARTLTPSVPEHFFGRLADSVDRSFDQAGKLLLNKPAVDMLRAADKFYSNGIKKFEDTTVQQLVNQAEKGAPPDASLIARTALKPEHIAAVKQLRRLVGEDVFRRVASADYRNMINKATSEIDGTVSGRKLLLELKNRGPLTKVVHGEKTTKDLQELAEGLAARDRHINAEDLQPGDIKNALVSLRESEKQADEYLKTNFLADLADPGKDPEQVYSYLARPGNESRLEKAITVFGDKSDVVQGLRQHATGELTKDVAYLATQGKEAASLKEALGKYTKKEQDLLFPNGLADDMRELAKEVEFLFPKAKDESMASFTSGGILQKNIFTRVYHQLNAASWRYLLQDPAVIRRISLGLHVDGASRIASRRAIKELVRYGTLEGNDDDPEEQQQ